MRKKKLLLGLCLNLGLATLAGSVSAATTPLGIKGDHHFTTDTTIALDDLPPEEFKPPTDGMGIELSNAGHRVTSEAGTVITITIDKAGIGSALYPSAEAITVRSGGGTVDLRESQVIIQDGASNFNSAVLATGASSNILLGDNTKIDVKQGSGLYSGSQATVSVGDNLEIRAGQWGSGHGIVAAGLGGQLTIGNNALIHNDSARNPTSSVKAHHFAIYASNAYNSTGTTTSITIGDDAKIFTSGVTQNHVVRVDQNAEVTIGKNALISAAGDEGIGIASGGYDSYVIHASNGGKVSIGEGSELRAEGKGSYGAVAQGAGAYILLNDNIQVNASGAGLFATGAGALIEGKDGLKITTADQNQTMGAYASTGGKVILGDNIEVYTQGTSGYGAYANGVGSTIEIGDGLIVDTKKDTGRAILANNSGTLSVGDGARITTAGFNASGIMANNAATISMGEDTQITTSGDSSYGVLANGANSKVTLEEEAQIRTSGDKAHALFAAGGGEIQLQGAIIESDPTKEAFAVVAEGTNTATSKISGDGIFSIRGDIYASEYSEIDLTMQAGSIFTGSTAMADTTSKLDLTMLDSRWNLLGDSQVGTLSLDGAMIDFANSAFGTTLTVDHLQEGTRGAVIAMKADICSETSDKLIVTGSAQGSHLIHVYNQGAANTTGNERITLVETPDSSTHQLDLLNTVELGGYKYNLRLNPDQIDHWELFGTKIATDPANAAINLFSGSYLINYAETQTLLQRMGELRNNDSKGNIWARTFGGKFKSNGDNFLRGYDMNYWGLQVGADKKFTLKNNKGDIYFGGMFGYTKGDIGYRRGSGSIDSKSLGIYGTYIAPSGFYSDLILKYGWMKDDFKVYDSAGNHVKGDDIITHGVTLSMEVGQKIHFNKKLKEGWYVEPQVQLSYGHQNGDSFTASNGLRIGVDSYNSVLGRLGTNIGYEVKGGKNPVNVYGKVSYVHEFDGDVDYRLNNSKESTSYGDSWWVYGVGITAQIGKKHNVYLDIERSSGGKFTQEWAINGGYRFAW